jgi:DNA (cytosine-5)-methyltransferase 1
MEAAVLQTFPRSYKFKGSGLESVAVQIGNALPRRFARVAGRAVIKYLSGCNGAMVPPRETAVPSV